MPKSFKILPKWWHFTKSGHTGTYLPTTSRVSLLLLSSFSFQLQLFLPSFRSFFQMTFSLCFSLCLFLPTCCIFNKKFGHSHSRPLSRHFQSISQQLTVNKCSLRLQTTGFEPWSTDVRIDDSADSALYLVYFVFLSKYFALFGPVLFFINGPIPASFCLFSSFSHHN